MHVIHVMLSDIYIIKIQTIYSIQVKNRTLVTSFCQSIKINNPIKIFI